MLCYLLKIAIFLVILSTFMLCYLLKMAIFLFSLLFFNVVLSTEDNNIYQILHHTKRIMNMASLVTSLPVTTYFRGAIINHMHGVHGIARNYMCNVKGV